MHHTSEADAASFASSLVQPPSWQSLSSSPIVDPAGADGVVSVVEDEDDESPQAVRASAAVVTSTKALMYRAKSSPTDQRSYDLPGHGSRHGELAIVRSVDRAQDLVDYVARRQKET